MYHLVFRRRAIGSHNASWPIKRLEIQGRMNGLAGIRMAGRCVGQMGGCLFQPEALASIMMESMLVSPLGQAAPAQAAEDEPEGGLMESSCRGLCG